jgi:uncharacterized protein DUF3467
MMAEEPQVAFKWIEGKEPAPEIYANYVHVSWSLFDVRFQLGQLVPTGEDLRDGFRIEKRGAVTVAWPEVKNLRDSLTDLVDRFERANGEIKTLKLPPSGTLPSKK